MFNFSSENKQRKQRVVVKTPFQVSVVQNDGSLRVVSSGHSDYKSAENWVKSDAKNELNLNGYVKFYIFHAKKQIAINFSNQDAVEDMEDVLTKDPGKPDRTGLDNEIIETEDVVEVTSDEDSDIGYHSIEEEATSPLDESSFDDEENGVF
jgi:hypothetical protein